LKRKLTRLFSPYSALTRNLLVYIYILAMKKEIITSGPEQRFILSVSSSAKKKLVQQEKQNKTKHTSGLEKHLLSSPLSSLGTTLVVDIAKLGVGVILAGWTSQGASC
jgi:hypothetical protein